ncbi:hypothetical protein ATN84_12880 [Paramesorhizobium deserti]|uniref:DUF1127 domain-containing protein n=1 Tax=Paramesorhizobium deserti TaxID=1494590 RepID=A0A135HUM8_9HYPH|nr:hypothetical protein [Paramesorhizobium deserti]KXF76896.1 hypothetical protein ATN84_12880 [Paramesorhizobium deserti]
MTTYDHRDRYEYKEWPDLFSDGIVRMIEGFVSRITGMFRKKTEWIAAKKRERDTIHALARLPENIRHDIGWPDLYERQHRKNGK